MPLTAVGRRYLGAITILLSLVACSSEARPTTAEYAPHWRAAQAEVPALAELRTDENSRERCDQGLKAIRSARSETLVPAPSETIEANVDDWVAAAEALLFECPTGDAATDPNGDIIEVMRSLEQLAAAIDASLDVQDDEDRQPSTTTAD